jgi:hypothetical protein
MGALPCEKLMVLDVCEGCRDIGRSRAKIFGGKEVELVSIEVDQAFMVG